MRMLRTTALLLALSATALLSGRAYAESDKTQVPIDVKIEGIYRTPAGYDGFLFANDDRYAFRLAYSDQGEDVDDITGFGVTGKSKHGKASFSLSGNESNGSRIVYRADLDPKLLEEWGLTWSSIVDVAYEDLSYDGFDATRSNFAGGLGFSNPDIAGSASVGRTTFTGDGQNNNTRVVLKGSYTVDGNNFTGSVCSNNNEGKTDTTRGMLGFRGTNNGPLVRYIHTDIGNDWQGDLIFLLDSNCANFGALNDVDESGFYYPGFNWKPFASTLPGDMTAYHVLPDGREESSRTSKGGIRLKHRYRGDETTTSLQTTLRPEWLTGLDMPGDPHLSVILSNRDGTVYRVGEEFTTGFGNFDVIGSVSGSLKSGEKSVSVAFTPDFSNNDEE
ncbi:hypothetical protein ACFLQN_02140 [Candidatus Aenigmatarchaeota archaeon]